MKEINYDLEYYNYDLPQELIANVPLENRSDAKLLIVNKYNKELHDDVFKNITDYLTSNDVLVFNNTKVLPARIYGVKESTGAKLEVLLLKETKKDTWECLVKHMNRLKEGTIIKFSNSFKGEVKNISNGIATIKFSYSKNFYEELDKLGVMPLPPYIHHKLEDKNRYQTVYATVPGSVAAPTAGLHFTKELLEEIRKKGVEILYITLNVGLGTFKPVKETDIRKHNMHSEYYEISEEVANKLNEAKEKGKRIVAVGTTSMRTLEANIKKYGIFKGACEETNIFIYPPYEFKAVDALITNFHLPKSTLLMLVSAFASHDIIMNAYNYAIKNKYRFFSFGDAMLITEKKEMNKMLKEFRKLLKSHRKDKNLIKFEEISCKKGTNNILLSAPHTFMHERNGKNKSKDYLTHSLIRVISELSNCHVMYINKEIDYDPNYDKENNFYYEYLKKYVRNNNIDYVIDIHSLMEKDITDLDIGVNDYKNVNHDKILIKDIIKELNKHDLGNITVDKIYKSHNNTICSKIHKDTGVKSIQLEIGQKNRNFHKNKSQVSNLINAILGVINYLENKSKFTSVIFKDKKGKKVIIRNTKKNKFDYEAKFDKVLDIKPAFGYERKLKDKIDYDEVGLEIEVSVTLERDKYSFTKKLLTNIKELVGENGYFVKDGTIIGDYSFEIVLDPLKTEEIYEFWNNLQEIMTFSKGLIQVSPEKNCGIHMNFNQYDITNPIESHKKLMALLSEKESYFEENIYKQYKFIWDFEEYCKYQKTISSKYLWVNYLDKKLVEVRNVKTRLSSIELVELIKKILNALYYDKDQREFDYKAFVTLNKIYDTAIDKVKSDKVFDELNKNGFVIIGFNNKTADIIIPNDEIVQEIKKDIGE